MAKECFDYCAAQYNATVLNFSSNMCTYAYIHVHAYMYRYMLLYMYPKCSLMTLCNNIVISVVAKSMNCGIHRFPQGINACCTDRWSWQH